MRGIMAYGDETLPKTLPWDKPPAMTVVTSRISLDEAEIEETFVRASGPGGQNVSTFKTS